MTDNLYTKLSHERKQLQEQGLVPDWYTTGGWQLFKEKYLYGTDEAVKGQFTRIAQTAAKHLKGTKFEKEAFDKFFNLFWKGWLSPSTPVLANMGTTRGLPVSCSGTYVDDSIDGFYSNRREVAILTKYGFGTASYLGGIRPRGAAISKGGKASGVLPVFKGGIQDMRDVAQGVARRGAWAGYIEIDHDGFDEIADFIESEPDDANVGWIIKDAFVAKLEAGDEDATRRFQKALKLKMLTGKGYFMFMDKINRKRPESYVKNNLEVVTSQLCVAPETEILTDNGYKVISTLENTKVNVWNGHEYSEVEVKKTGVQQGLIKVTLHDGRYLDCTPQHKFYIKTQFGAVEKQAQELQPEDRLIDLVLPTGIYSSDSVPVVKEVLNTGRVDDTFCFTEPKRHMGVFNGILTGQCSEITLFCDNDHTFTCVLSSMNVAKYDEWKDTDAVQWATIFLDCVASEFIEQAKSISGLEKAVRYTEKGRSLGLGQCGFHTYLQQRMIPFENFEAHMLNLEIANFIDKESKVASKELADELGEPEWCKGLGIRNSHLVAVAPTKSTALLMGGVSEGINPDPAMSFTQLTAAGEVDRLNPVLLNLMKKKGVYSVHKVKEIADKRGSVQHVDWLTDEEKEVFKTAFEINMKAVLRLAATRGRYIDQWQSLNLFFSAEADPAWIAEVHQEAFLDEGILGLYYVYTQAGVQSADGECIACQ